MMTRMMTANATLFSTSFMQVPLSILFTAIIAVSIAVLLSLKRNMNQRGRPKFPLMEVPSEVRLIIFEHLIDLDLAEKESAKAASTLPKVQSLLRAWRPSPRYSLLSSITLVSRKIREEFLQVYCQRAPFTFTLDASHTDNDSLWKITPRILSSIRTCRLRILATPDIVGGFDPRHVSGDWQLRNRVFSLMDQMTHLKDFRLSIQACGNQLWNPIWLWHYTSQSFKESEVKAFKRMSFDLEGWNMKEPNHLARNKDGDWEWRCNQDHHVQPDTENPQAIRHFCGSLYAECHICDPQEGQIDAV